MNTPSMIAKSVAFCLVCVFAAIVVIAALPGCAIPIPPSGPDLGKYGYFRLTPSYEPNALTTPYLNNINNWTNYVSTNSFK
jgi:hypothetical protein